ncbi:MAG TPA: serpin family protein [Desulfatiglandales bacterium]|nr:serpin family protein [Desulfatiglandales bacterium]
MRIKYLIGIVIVIILLGLSLVLSGCGSDSDSSTSSTETSDLDTTSNETILIQSDKERNTSPDVSEEDISTLVEGNTAFTLDLYHFLANEKQDENRFFSPYSISLCFAMVYGAARNNTEAQMEEVFHYTLGQDYLHSAFNALDLDLTSREQDYDGDGEKDFKLNIANSMWGQKNYKFLTEYLDLLAENYGAGIQLLDLQHEPDSSCEVINDWVSEKTEGLIDSIIRSNDLNEYSLFVLVNAIYFKAKWMNEFQEESTADDLFYAPQGEVTIPMMHQWCYVNYGEGENYQAAEIPYKGNTTGMLVLLPREGKFEEFESSLTTERLAQIIENLESQEVVLKLPKFDCEPDEIDLKDVLSQMGMTDPFVFTVGDFSGMDGIPRWIYIHFARHKAFVSVDEQGTEAAAATVVGGGGGGYPSPPEIEFIVNRPFIFFIRDRVTGAILFMGRILDPS